MLRLIFFLLFFWGGQALAANDLAGVTISWRRASSTKYAFLVRSVWVSGSNHDALTLDGSLSTSTPVKVGSCSDTAGVAYEVFEETFDLEYTSIQTLHLTGCCRMPGIINGVGTAYHAALTVNPTSDSWASPSVYLPSGLQFVKGMQNFFQLPIFDTDGSATTCRLATPSESGLSAQASCDSQIQVTSSCRLEWDLQNCFGDVTKSSVQIIMMTADTNEETTVEFFVELLPAQQMSSSVVGVLPSVISLLCGTPYSVSFTVDNAAGTDIEMVASTLPSGMAVTTSELVILPAGGSSVTSTVTYTPLCSDLGAFSVVLVWKNSANLKTTQSVNFEVAATTAICPTTTISNAVNGLTGSTGSLVVVSCQAGYQVTGAAAVSCLANGKWVEPVPSCTSIPCPSVAVSNGSPSLTGSFGSSVYVTCDAGYGGSGTATCSVVNDVVSWTDIPTCRRNCGMPSKTNWAFSSSCSHLNGLTCPVQCANGFTGSPSALCLADGRWSYSGQCNAVFTRSPWRYHLGLPVEPKVCPNCRIGYSSQPSDNTLVLMPAGCYIYYHGDFCEYAAGIIPEQSDAGWRACGPYPSNLSPLGQNYCPDPVRIGMHQWSQLCNDYRQCSGLLDFSFYETIVSIPSLETVSDVRIVYDGMDDGAKVTIFNSKYPGGQYASYGTIGQVATTDLKSYMVVGENRIVISQVDDCCSGNNLGSALVTVSGVTIATTTCDNAFVCTDGLYDAGSCTYPPNENCGLSMPTTAIEGTPFTVSLAIPAGVTGLRYMLSCSGSQQTVTYTAAKEISTTSCVFPDQGTYTIWGAVVDAQGRSASYTKTITVANAAPTAEFVSYGSVPEGSDVVFELKNVHELSPVDAAAGLHYAFACPGKSLTGITWATAGTVPSGKCHSLDNGVMQILGMVIDKDGGSSQYTIQATVSEVIPTGSLTGLTVVTPDVAVAFSMINVGHPAGADFDAGLRFAFACPGDLLPAVSYAASSTTTTHLCTFSEVGTFEVRGRVVDKDNSYSDCSFSVVVANVPPVATVQNNGPVPAGSAVLVSMVGTDDSADLLAGLHYAFDCQNGDLATASYSTTDSTSGVTCTFPESGEYFVSGRVIDQHGDSTLYHSKVVVTNIVPSAELQNNGPIPEGSSVTITFVNQIDTPGDLAAGLHYAFSCLGGSLAAATYQSASVDPSTSCYFGEEGLYTVTGVVIDDEGASRQYSTLVLVNNVAPTATFVVVGPIFQYSTTTVSISNAFDPSPADTQGGFRYAFSCLGLPLDGIVYTAASPTPSQQCDFGLPGTYPVSGKIIDDDNGETFFVTTLEVIPDDCFDGRKVPLVTSAPAGALHTQYGTVGISLIGQVLQLTFTVDDASKNLIKEMNIHISVSAVPKLPGTEELDQRSFEITRTGLSVTTYTISQTLAAAGVDCTSSRVQNVKVAAHLLLMSLASPETIAVWAQDTTRDKRMYLEISTSCRCKAADVVLRNGSPSYGNSIQVQLSKTFPPNPKVAPKAVESKVASGRRQLLEYTSEVCSNMQPTDYCSMASEADNGYILDCDIKVSGSIVFCVQNNSDVGSTTRSSGSSGSSARGYYLPSASPLQVSGPNSVMMDGSQCVASDAPLEVGNSQPLKVVISGSNLQPSDVWWVVTGNAECGQQPTQGQRGFSRGTHEVALPGTGNITICYQHQGVIIKLPTCATSVLETDDDGQSSSSVVIIAGACVGVVVAALAAIALAFYCHKKRKAASRGLYEESVKYPECEEAPAQLTELYSPLLNNTPLVPLDGCPTTMPFQSDSVCH